MIELETQRKQRKDDISREGGRGRERDVTLKIKPESELRKKNKNKAEGKIFLLFLLA